MSDKPSADEVRNLRSSLEMIRFELRRLERRLETLENVSADSTPPLPSSVNDSSSVTHDIRMAGCPAAARIRFAAAKTFSSIAKNRDNCPVVMPSIPAASLSRPFA